MNQIPKVLYEDLSKSLIGIVLSDRTAKVPVELAKRIIYFWRTDALQTQAGIEALVEASLITDKASTLAKLNLLGLHEIIVSL